MKLKLVPTAEVDQIWPLLSKKFQRACNRSGADDLNAGTLWQMARSGEAFLILGYDGNELLKASLWQFDPIDNYEIERGAAFRCLMLFGRKIPHWYEPMFELIKNIALDNGATRLVAKGRRGWLRYCAGAVKINNQYEVELNYGRWIRSCK